MLKCSSCIFYLFSLCLCTLFALLNFRRFRLSCSLCVQTVCVFIIIHIIIFVVRLALRSLVSSSISWVVRFFPVLFLVVRSSAPSAMRSPHRFFLVLFLFCTCSVKFFCFSFPTISIVQNKSIYILSIMPLFHRVFAALSARQRCHCELWISFCIISSTSSLSTSI